MAPRLTASLLHLSLITSGLGPSCAASLRSLPLSPARTVFSELNGNEHGDDGFCKWTLQNFVPYPLSGDVLVRATRAGGGVIRGRRFPAGKLTFTEVGTLGNRCTWERSCELRLGRSGPLRGLLPATALATTGRAGGRLRCEAPGKRTAVDELPSHLGLTTPQ